MSMQYCETCDMNIDTDYYEMMSENECVECYIKRFKDEK